MSIRHKILLPLLGFMLLGGLLSAVTGLTGLSAFGELSDLAGRTVEASEASRPSRDRFRRAEALVARVTARTDLLDVKRIGGEFTANADALDAGLGRLKASALSERMLALSNTAEAEARQWRDGRADLEHRQPDQPPRAERDDRGGAPARPVGVSRWWPPW